MRWLPQSLFGRLLAALLGVVGAMLLVMLALIVRERQELAFFGSETADLVELVADTSMALAALPAEQRGAEIARLRGEGLLLERSARDQLPPRPPDQAETAAREVEARLAATLGGTYTVGVAPARGDPGSALRVRSEPRASAVRGGQPPGESRPFEGPPGDFEGRGGFDRGGRGPPPGDPGGLRGPGADFGRGGPDGPNGFGRGDGSRGPGPDGPGGPGGRGGPGGPGGRGGPQLDIAVALPDGFLVPFRSELPRAGAPLPRALFIELAALTLVLGAALYFMARTITRPLAELAGAADAVGRGERHAPLPETGARELRDATRAFNAMQERLHRYLDSRTRVLAAMSHDLRTPLTRLRLRAESLTDDGLRERFASDLDEMSAMVIGALQLFRGLDAQEPVTPVDVDALLATLKAELAELGHDVGVEGRANAPLAARAQVLKRCLTNLLSNAVKYGGGAHVVVEDGDALVIRIADDGPGIPEEHLERVFEPFFRLEASRNSETGGTGLGLSIARDVAQAHGGSLVLRNRAPRGLEAVLTLPRRA